MFRFRSSTGKFPQCRECGNSTTKQGFDCIGNPDQQSPVQLQFLCITFPDRLYNLLNAHVSSPLCLRKLSGSKNRVRFNILLTDQIYCLVYGDSSGSGSGSGSRNIIAKTKMRQNRPFTPSRRTGATDWPSPL